MQATLVAVMTPAKGVFHKDGEVRLPVEPVFQLNNALEDLDRLAGAHGGICYMGDSFFDSAVTHYDKALSRSGTVIGTGHHSISDHAQMSIVLEGISKIMAMYINNLRPTGISEKSGRYTKMTSIPGRQKELYEEWADIIKKAIIREYGSKIDAKTVDKLGNENARYFLSVFTPATTESYTTSKRNWNYLLDWLLDFVATPHPNTYFFNTLKAQMLELHEALYPIVYSESLRDFKKINGLDLLNFTDDYTEYTNIIGRTYDIFYKASIVSLAQLHRHRILKYLAYFNGVSTEFYTPPVLNKAEREKWLLNMAEVAEFIPQATLLVVNESGRLKDFVPKYIERACGRAQLETSQICVETAKLFITECANLGQAERKWLDRIATIEGVKSKCEMITKCKEPCVWGAKGFNDRKI